MEEVQLAGALGGSFLNACDGGLGFRMGTASDPDDGIVRIEDLTELQTNAAVPARDEEYLE